MIRDRNAAFGWWHDLVPREGYRGDRAALAQLRRCATVAEAMMEPATLDLFRRLGAETPRDLPPVALAAAVLAHVKSDVSREGSTVARRVGPDNPDDPSTALLKPLRFKRLLDARTEDERLAAFRRLVRLADGALPVRDLAQALLDWSESRRRRWVYDYWQAGQPSPTRTPSAPQETASA